MKTIDKYLFQAMDKYPYWLEDTIESLGYALSYNDRNTMTLCLFGRVYAEQLFDYATAATYFERALAVDVNAIEVYPHYIRTLLLDEEYEKAQKLLDFAVTLKGCDKAEILLCQALLFERCGKYKKAAKIVEQARLASFAKDQIDNIGCVERRLKDKMARTKKRRKDK